MSHDFATKVYQVQIVTKKYTKVNFKTQMQFITQFFSNL